jgi:hypothetical protein
VDKTAEALLINGYAIKLIPQRVRNLSLLAAVIPPNHPALSASANPESGPTSLSVKSPDVVEALAKLERNGMVTADVDLFVTYEGDLRLLAIRVRVLQVEGQVVTSRDTLTAIISTPQPAPSNHKYSHPNSPTEVDAGMCVEGDLKCKLTSWLKALVWGGSCQKGVMAGGRPHFRHGHGKPGHHGHHGGWHRHHKHKRPGRHGFMRFIIHVLVPVSIGAAAGVGVGVLSVLVAEIVGGLVMRLRGRASRQYDEIDTRDEDEEQLPAYEVGEAVPRYSDEK